MTQHTLQGRSEDRSHLVPASRRPSPPRAAWLALGGMGHGRWPSNAATWWSSWATSCSTASACWRSRRCKPATEIQTGPGSRLVFVIGDAAFHVRQNSRLSVERGATLNAVSLLRLLTGAVVSVFGRGSNRTISHAHADRRHPRHRRVHRRSWTTRVAAPISATATARWTWSPAPTAAFSQASYHQSVLGRAGRPRNGRFIRPANAINHTDEELEFLARLVGQRTAWQIAGKKGVKDGKGYMDDKAGQMHPAMTMPVR